jgi:hypothetical protein
LGPEVSEAVSDVLLAKSELATVSMSYIDAYPEGFELQISGTTSIPFDELRRDGEDSGADIFGRHWPMVDEPRELLPPQLLRVGVQFSDGRAATSIGGHDRPMSGSVISPLSGGVSGSADGTRFRHGYWISPLPPPGVLTVLCEWPALDIALTRAEVQTALLLGAAERAQVLFPGEGHVLRHGQQFPIGTDADVKFITDATIARTAIGGTIAPIYEAYCTVRLPDGNDAQELHEHEHAVIDILQRSTGQDRWWLGYLDTGAHDVVFPFAPRVTPFYGHQYVLIKAGPQQAVAWRQQGWNWALPDLMFPQDRSWLLSTGWDDSWTCIGGPEWLISEFLRDTILGPRTERLTAG